MSTPLTSHSIAVLPDNSSDLLQFVSLNNTIIGGFSATGVPYGGPAPTPNPILTVTVPLTPTQLDGLHSTPVNLIPGVTGSVIVPVKILFNYTFLTTAFTITGTDGFFYIGYHGFVDANSVAKVEDAGTVDQTSSNIAIPAIALTKATVANSSGLGLDIAMADTLTLGAGSVTLTIDYRVIPVA